MAFDKSCCSIIRGIYGGGAECLEPTGGINKLYVACIKDVVFCEYQCSASSVVVSQNQGSDTGCVDVEATAPSANDAHVFNIAGITGNTTPFHEIEFREGTAEHLWTLEYDNDTDNFNRTETINFSTNIKDNAFYCTIKNFIGQEVIFLWQEKGTNRWYLSGRFGDMTFTEISGGTGTEERTPSTFTATGTNLDDIHLRVYIDDEGSDGTDAALETLFAAQV